MSNKGDHRFVDICVLVRDLFSKEAADSVKSPIRILEFLIPRIAQRLSLPGEVPFKIELESRSWAGKHLRGMLLRYEHHARIIYSPDGNTCWRRFVVCKELAHLLIDDDPKHFTTDPVALVQQIISGIPLLEPHSDCGSESLAVFAAVEMLMPWRLRSMAKELAKTKTDLEIALQFRMPVSLVTMALNSPYDDLSTQSNSFSAV